MKRSREWEWAGTATLFAGLIVPRMLIVLWGFTIYAALKAHRLKKEEET